MSSELVERLIAWRKQEMRAQQHQHADLLALVVERLALLERILGSREYALARPALMPDMSGRERYTLVSGATFPTGEAAALARSNVPAMRSALFVSRIPAVSEWELDDD